MADYKTYCDEFFDQDAPFDSSAIKSVKEGQEAIWTACTPSTAVWFNSQDPEGGFGEEVRWAAVSERCVFLRSYLITPGLKELKIHLRGMAQDWEGTTGRNCVSFAAGVGVGYTRGSWTELQHGSSSSTTTITVPVPQVERPEIRLVQVWMKSTFDDSPTENTNTLGTPDYEDYYNAYIVGINPETKEAQFLWRDAMGTGTPPSDWEEYPHLYAVGWYNQTSGNFQNVLQVLSVVEDSSASSSILTLAGIPSALDAANLDDSTTGTYIGWGLAAMSYYQCETLAIQGVRHTAADALDSITDSTLMPGEPTESITVTGQLSNNNRLFNEPRPLSISSGRSGGALAFDIDNATLTPDSQSSMLIYPHTGSTKIAIYFLYAYAKTGQTEDPDTINVSWTLTSEGAAVESTTIVGINIPNRVAPHSTGSLAGELRDWGYTRAEVDQALDPAGGGIGFAKVVIEDIEWSGVYGDGMPTPLLLDVSIAWTAATNPLTVDRLYFLPFVCSEEID